MSLRNRQPAKWMDVAPARVTNFVMVGLLLVLAAGSALGVVVATGWGLPWFIVVAAAILAALCAASIYATIIEATVGAKYKPDAGNQQ